MVAAAERLEKAAGLFQELREVLRLGSLPDAQLLRGRRPAQTSESKKVTVRREKQLQTWCKSLEKRYKRESDPDKSADQATVLRCLEKYRKQLAGHVIEGKNRRPFVVSRTNNPLEHRFGSTKRGLR